MKLMLEGYGAQGMQAVQWPVGGLHVPIPRHAAAERPLPALGSSRYLPALLPWCYGRWRARRRASLWPSPTELELQALATEPEALPLLDGRRVRAEHFSRPCRLSQLTEDWEVRAWDLPRWRQAFESKRFRLRPCSSLHRYGYAGPSLGLTTLEGYFESSQRGTYIFENDFGDPEILAKLKVPEVLRHIHGAPIFSVSKRHTGVGFHRHSTAWLAQLQGSKLWLLVPGAEITAFDATSEMEDQKQHEKSIRRPSGRAFHLYQ